MPVDFAVVPAAHVYLRRGNEILLQQRSNTGYMDGCWVASAAGHIEPHETAAFAGVREAREELGVVLTGAQLVPLTLLQRTDGTDDARQQRADWYFMATEWTGEPHIMEPTKCSGLGWFHLADLPTPIPAYERVVLDGLAHDALPSFTYFGFASEGVD